MRNSLHLVYGLLTSEGGATHDQASIAAFRSIALHVLGLAGVFDYLLGVGMNTTIDFVAYVEAQCDSLLELYKGEIVKLCCSTDAVGLDLDFATSLGIVITELVSNGFMHAFPGGSGEIHVEFSNDLGRAPLSVTDNGIVSSSSKPSAAGLVWYGVLLNRWAEL